MTDEISNDHQREADRQAETVDDARQHIARGVVGAQQVPPSGGEGAARPDRSGVVGIGHQRPDHPAGNHRVPRRRCRARALGHGGVGIIKAQLGAAGADQALHLGCAEIGLGAELAAEGGFGIELLIGK
jgi:hypothetical protein